MYRPPSPQEKLEKGPLLRFFLRGRGSVHRLIEIHQSQNTNWFLRGPLRWLTAAKNANVSWPLNFRVRVFLKSAVKAATFLSKSSNMPWRNQICIAPVSATGIAKCLYSKETTCPRICSKSRSKSAKSSLPVGVRRSKTSIFNVEQWNKCVGYRLGYRFSSVQSCTKSHACKFLCFSLPNLQDHGLLRSRLCYHDNVR